MNFYVVMIYLIYFITCVSAKDSTSKLIDPAGWNSVQESMDDLVDPSGWNYDRETKNFKRPRKDPAINCDKLLEICSSDVENYCKSTAGTEDDISETPKVERVPCKCNSTPKCENELQFMRRFIKLFLNAAHLSRYKITNGGSSSGLIDITVTEEDLQVLDWFGDPDRDISWRQLDTVMTRVINSGLHMSKEYFTWMDNIFFYLSFKEVWLGAALFCVIMFVILLFRSGHSLSGASTIIFSIFFIVSFAMEFSRLHKEAEAEQMAFLKQHPEIPLACRPNDQTWYQSFHEFLTSSYQFKSDDCVKYYTALTTDPLIKVSLSRVLSNILADFILAPAKKFGEAIAFFSSGVLANLPTLYGVPILMTSGIVAFMLLFFVVLRLFGGKISFRSLIFSVDIGADNRQLQDSSTPVQAPLSSATDSGMKSDPAHPMVKGFSSSSGDDFVLLRASSLEKLMSPKASQNILESSLEPNILQHRNPVEHIASPSVVTKENNKISVGKENIEVSVNSTKPIELTLSIANSPIKMKEQIDSGSKETDKLSQMPLKNDESSLERSGQDGSGDATSCIPEQNIIHE